MSDTARARAEYVPTTEEVKHDYSWDGFLDAPLVSREQAFDRWLAAEVAAAKAEAWDEGWEAAVDEAPGDIWFDEWTHDANPYRTERTTDGAV